MKFEQTKFFPLTDQNISDAVTRYLKNPKLLENTENEENLPFLPKDILAVYLRGKTVPEGFTNHALALYQSTAEEGLFPGLSLTLLPRLDRFGYIDDGVPREEKTYGVKTIYLTKKEDFEAQLNTGRKERENAQLIVITEKPGVITLDELKEKNLGFQNLNLFELEGEHEDGFHIRAHYDIPPVNEKVSPKITIPLSGEFSKTKIEFDKK